MAYSITLYAGDIGIAKSNIYVSNQTNLDVDYMGQDDNGDDRFAYQKGFTNNAKFTATPATGYKFKRWVYRTESTLNATNPMSSTSNPFIYTDRENIYIRVESEISSSGGGGNTNNPTVTMFTATQQPGSKTAKYQIRGSNLTGVSFEIKVNGWLKDSGTFSDDETAGFLDFDNYGEYNVVLTYSGKTKITTVSIQEGEWVIRNGSGFVTINSSEYQEGTMSVQSAYSIYRYPIKFVYRTRFAFGGESDIIPPVGYISTDGTINKKTGMPNGLIASGNADGSEYYFDLSIVAEPDVQYYAWLRCYDGAFAESDITYANYWFSYASPYKIKGRGLISGNWTNKTITLPFTDGEYVVYQTRIASTVGGNITIEIVGEDVECWVVPSPSLNEFPLSENISTAILHEKGNNLKLQYTAVNNQAFYLYTRHINPTDTNQVIINVTYGTKADITKWSWTDSNGDATLDETVKAYAAITATGATTDFSHKVWNDIVNKVAEIVAAEDDEWYENYDSLANTKMTAPDEELSALAFNSLRFNVGARENAPPTEISDKMPRDAVEGWFFTKLTECINTWIDNL